MKQDADGEQCPVCKTGVIEASRSYIGYRIEPSSTNFERYGYQVIFHNMNALVCDTQNCANRVTASWSGPGKEGLRLDLVKKIREDIAKFLKAMEAVSGAPMSSVKRLTKEQYKKLRDEGRANGTLVRL